MGVFLYAINTCTPGNDAGLGETSRCGFHAILMSDVTLYEYGQHVLRGVRGAVLALVAGQ